MAASAAFAPSSAYPRGVIEPSLAGQQGGIPAMVASEPLSASPSANNANPDSPGAAGAAPRACQTCRSRKVKCDGAQPCGACVRSAKHKGEDASHLVCHYDQGPRKRAARKVDPEKQNKKAKIALLEQRLNQLEGQLKAAGGQPDSPQAGLHYSASRQPELNASASYMSQASANVSWETSGLDALLSATSQSHGGFGFEDPNAFSRASDDASFSLNKSTHISPLSSTNLSPVSDESLFALFHPGWPSDLPEPAFVDRLIDIFFKQGREMASIICEPRFRRHYNLPPTHGDFPNRSLIHAMIAATTIFVGDDMFSGQTYYLPGTPRSYHCKASKAAMQEELCNVRFPLRIGQAMVLLCHVYHWAAEYVELWMHIGATTRTIGPLGLNNLQSPLTDQNDSISMKTARGKRNKRTFVITPNSAEELAEASFTFWRAFAADRSATVSTSWMASVNEDDVTTLLPHIPLKKGELTAKELASLDIASPTFLTSHAESVVGPRQLLIKSYILLGRVQLFVNRAPAPLGKGRRLTGPDAVRDFRSSQAFTQMENDVLHFGMSLPRYIQNGVPDYQTAFIRSAAHASMIILHEPFALDTTNSISHSKCLSAARAIVGDVYNLINMSVDVSTLETSQATLWMVAGRILVRELALQTRRGQYDGFEMLLADITLLQSMLKAHRSPMAQTCHDQLQAFLDNPDVLLDASDLVPTCDGMVELEMKNGIGEIFS